MEKKKILIFSLAYYPDFVGGAEVAIKEVTDRIPSEEVSFDMVTAKMNSRQSKFEKIGNVNVYRVGIGNEFIDKFIIPISGFFKAVSLNKKNNYNLFWCMMANQVSVAASFFKIFKKEIPLILTIQEGDEEEHLKRYVGGSEFLYKIFIKPWHLLVFRKADRATAISQALSLRIEKNNFKGKINIIPNGVDIEAFSKSYRSTTLDKLKEEIGFEKDDKILITTSRLVEKNAVEDIISALKFLPENYKLLVLGTGHLLYKLQNLSEKEGVYERVKFLGFVDREEMPKYLKMSEVFIRPSLSEGMGNSFIEAFAAGTPVITTPVGGIVDFLEDNVTGLFCKVKNPESIALKVKLLEKDEHLKKEIVRRAKKVAKEGYSWDSIAESYKNEFQDFKNEPKKIIIATGIFPPQTGGPAYYALNLSKELSGLGNKVEVVTYGWERKLPSGLRHIVYFFKLFFRSFGSDMIIALDTFSVGLPATWVKSVTGKKLLIRTGGDFLWEMFVNTTGEKVKLSDFYSNIELSGKFKKIFNLTKFTLHKTDRLIFSTDWQEEIFTKAYDLDRSKNFIVENHYKKNRKSETSKKKNFLWAGRDIPLKNIDTLKKAFDKAKKERSDIELDILSEVSREELLKKISECYAVVLPSISEVSPNFILEAISYEKPFIVTSDTGIKERVAAAGIFVNSLDEDEIKEKILYLADDSNYLDQKNKVMHFDFEHSYKEIAEEILEISKY